MAYDITETSHCSIDEIHKRFENTAIELKKYYYSKPVKSLATLDKSQEKKEEEEKKQRSREKLQVLLEVLDGYLYLNGCIIVMTTNHINHLDPALIRPGRMDEHFEFGYLETNQAKNIVEFFYPNEWISWGTFNIPKDTKLTTSYLINTMILPNRRNFNFINSWINDCQQELPPPIQKISPTPPPITPPPIPSINPKNIIIDKDDPSRKAVLIKRKPKFTIRPRPVMSN